VREPLLRRLLEGQEVHLAGLLVFVGAAGYAGGLDVVREGSLFGIGAGVWFAWGVAIPVAHQLYVALCWRVELHAGLLTRALGGRAFGVYAAGFAVLGGGRVLSVVALSVANAGTVPAPRWLLWGLALAAAVPAGWLFHSVHRHFGFRRALGADHFDPAFRELPLVREGIFRYTTNGMYVFGFLLLRAPALALGSAAGLAAALFSHLYIWVHYGATERPDMRRIHG
jgi:hypothetical protein